jgi:hypothetical protein
MEAVEDADHRFRIIGARVEAGRNRPPLPCSIVSLHILPRPLLPRSDQTAWAGVGPALIIAQPTRRTMPS